MHDFFLLKSGFAYWMEAITAWAETTKEFCNMLKSWDSQSPCYYRKSKEGAELEDKS